MFVIDSCSFFLWHIYMSSVHREQKISFFKNSFFVITTLHEVCYYIKQPIQQYKKNSVKIFVPVIRMTYIYVMPIKIMCQSYRLYCRMDWLIHWHTSCHVIIIKKWIFEKIKLSVPCVRMTYIYVIGKRPRVNHKC